MRVGGRCSQPEAERARPVRSRLGASSPLNRAEPRRAVMPRAARPFRRPASVVGWGVRVDFASACRVGVPRHRVACDRPKRKRVAEVSMRRACAPKVGVATARESGGVDRGCSRVRDRDQRCGRDRVCDRDRHRGVDATFDRIRLRRFTRVFGVDTIDSRRRGVDEGDHELRHCDRHADRHVDRRRRTDASRFVGQSSARTSRSDSWSSALVHRRVAFDFASTKSACAREASSSIAGKAKCSASCIDTPASLRETASRSAGFCACVQLLHARSRYRSTEVGRDVAQKNT